MGCPPHGGEQCLRIGEVSNIAARHDGKRCFDGPFLTPRYGRIQMPVPALGEHLRMIAGDRRLDRRHVDEKRTFRRTLRNAVPAKIDLGDDGRVVDHRHDGVSLRHGRLRVVRNRCDIRKQLRLGARAVPDGQVEARRGNVARHGRAHDAGADEGDIPDAHGGLHFL